MKAASPVLNGEVEETDRKALRLDLTQPWHPVAWQARGARAAGVVGGSGGPRRGLFAAFPA